MNRARPRQTRNPVSKPRTRHLPAPARLPVETLESRVFLSGSVLVSVVNGSLNVRGDSEANAIVVDRAGLTAGQLRVTGTDGTAVNGQSAAFVADGVTADALFRMEDGGDSVTLRNLSLPGHLTVVSEHVAFQSVEVERNTRVTSKRGTSLVTIDDSNFHGHVGVHTGRGGDAVQIESHGDPAGAVTTFDRRLAVMLNSGDDTLQVGVTGEAGNQSVSTGRVRYGGARGSDTLRNVDAATYTGNPQFRVRSFETNETTFETTAPTVSSTAPANNATGVARNRKVAATFSEAMNPLTIVAANVTVTGPGSAPVAGTVSYVGTTMTFTPAAPLAADTAYTGTITTGARDLAGNALGANFVWSFTTGSTLDTAAPTVSSTDPSGGAAGVAVNKKVAATFSEAMDPSTVTAATFTLAGPGGSPVSGAVTYVGTTATFTPAAAFAADTTYTATVTTGATDLAGNALAADSTWTFTTNSTADTSAPTVTATNPADLKTNVLINKTVAATFSESMDPLTVVTSKFTVTAPGGNAVAGTLDYDAASRTATFTPSANFAPGTTFTATVEGGPSGVKDLAGNPLAADEVWTFTTGSQIAQAPVNLGRAAPFALMATASVSGTGATQINGDVGLNPGSAQGIPPSQVNGTIHVTDQAVIDAQADLLAAYNDATGRSTTSVSLPGNMGGLTFTPGLYTNSSSVLISGAGPANNVTLDAQGDENAIFIFQMGSTLTTGPGAQVILAGGAKAGNVFWQVGTSATLDTTTIFKGNILASVTITVNNGSAVEGRLLAGSNSDGSITVNGSTITVPAA
jgi:hypothetical protein